jgi:hypothetical protein
MRVQFWDTRAIRFHDLSEGQFRDRQAARHGTVPV